MHDFRDLADLAEDPDTDNDTWCALHRLAQQITSVPDDGPGPVPDETRDAVVAALLDAADQDPCLIPESEFTDYARELAEDCGMVATDGGWPGRHIDWQAAADELRQDYTEYDYNGESCYTRA
jgi:hypothetical protein